MDGTIGGANRIPIDSLKSQYIDIFTNHYYWGNTSPSTDAKLVASYNKAFIAGEYGLQTNSWIFQFAEATINTPEVSGCLIWSYRYYFKNSSLDITALKVDSMCTLKEMDMSLIMHQDFPLPQDFLLRSKL